MAIDFYDDADGFFWHHRVHLHRLDGARWVFATPTLDVETVDLAEHRVVPIGPNVANFLARIADELFAFDPQIDPNDLARIRCQACELALVLGAPAGAAVAVPGDAEWLYADTALVNFAEKVPYTIMGSPDTSVVREAAGLARIDIDGELTWVHVARVLQRDKDEWRQEKQSGPGRDPRLAGFRASTQEAVALAPFARWCPSTPPPPRSHRIGRSAIPRTLHSSWRAAASRAAPRLRCSTTSGSHGVASQNAALSRSSIFMIFHLMVTYDQYNMANSAVGELLARNFLRI